MIALRQRVPEDDRQRHRRQRQTQRIQPPRRDDEHGRRDDHEHRRLDAAHRAARDLAVRGSRIQRVEPRVDQPVESHRRAARRNHRHQNPSDHRPGDRRVPRRQQRARQRERQREHRVAEADERQVGAKRAQSWVRYALRSIRRPTTAGRARFRTPGILPHRSRRPEPSTARIRARFPGSSVPYSASKPSARAPCSVALSRSCDAGTRRRQRPHRRQLGEHIQVWRAGEAVGADGDRDAGGVEVARSAARRRRCAPLLRGQVTSVVPRAASRARSSRVICTPCTASTRASRKPESSRILDRADARRDPVRIPRPTSSSKRAPRSAAGRDELHLLRATPTGARCRARKAGGRSRPRIARKTSGATEYGA